MKEPETNEEFIYSLIIDDLDHSISSTHRALLLEWRSLEANEKTYQDFVEVHHNINELYAQQPYTANASWAKLDAKIGALDVSLSTQNTKNLQLRYWAGIAAAIIFTFSIGYYFISTNQYISVSNAQGAGIKRVFLPDGTQVNLNGGTLIKYAKNGFENHRSLQLVNGEVFISVVHQDKSPFVVDLGAVHAVDIGTSFNLFRNKKEINLTVAEGVVALKQTKGDSSLVLTKGKIGHYSIQTGKLSTSTNTNINYKSWMDKNFVFTETPVKLVMKQLADVYHTNINIKGDNLVKRKLTAHLQYQTVDSALYVIAETLQCKLSGSAGNYILSQN